MKSISRPALFIIRGRAYGVQVATKQRDVKLNAGQDVKVSRLPNGVVVASLETLSPVSSLAILYNSGPRYESPSELGLSHYLRSAVCQSTQKATGFNIAKNLQQIGSSLSCSTNREQTIYSVNFLRSEIGTALQYLNQVATAPVFKPWEVDDGKNRLKLDLDVLNSSLGARLVEALHKAAYRDTLGQSLYIAGDRIGSFGPRCLESFVGSHHVSHNAAVAGIGVDHELLAHAARKLTVRQGAAPSAKKAKYHGGELRVDVAGDCVHAAVAYEGFGFGSNDVLPALVLQQALGGAPFIQYGLNLSRVNKAASSVTTDPFTVSSFSLNYSDSGLFGFQTMASKHDAGKVLRAVATAVGQVFKSGLTEADLKTARAQVKSQLQLNAECPNSLLESVGVQALLSGRALTASQLSSLVDKVTADDVNRVAKQIAVSKPTMAAVGNLVSTPYLDELF